MAVKRAKPARSERHKLVLVAILAVCLGAILLWPQEAAEAPPQDARPLADKTSPGGGVATRGAKPAQGTQSSQSAASAESHAAAEATPAIAAVKLPRLDSQTIAAADPFTPLSQASSGSLEPDDPRREAVAAAAARASVRAVYRTSRGAAAIVDDQIIPVKDAKHWIATLRAAE